ncbi:hypothetical protein RIF29_04721 [Crotalaria pallida]|uniref:Uncharacterized protein n=1 Tax=Crotalaria pallida TaxID=3830 RepID=A0AAN9P9Z3_CROPI
MTMTMTMMDLINISTLSLPVLHRKNQCQLNFLKFTPESMCNSFVCISSIPLYQSIIDVLDVIAAKSG